MVTLLTSSSCLSCRRAKAWLEEEGITFVERNISSNRLTINEVKALIRLTENGVDEVISKRSKAFKIIKERYETLSMKELFVIISQNPEILRSPLLLDNKRLVIGFSEDQIRCFLPRKARTLFLRNAHFTMNE